MLIIKRFGAGQVLVLCVLGATAACTSAALDDGTPPTGGGRERAETGDIAPGPGTDASLSVSPPPGLDAAIDVVVPTDAPSSETTDALPPGDAATSERRNTA